MDNFQNHNGYISCIKVAGISVLPPLITDEIRKEIKIDREKAIEIEKKLKRKRASIDSGVMTGSYMESNKNCDIIDNTTTPYDISDSDIISLQYLDNNISFLIPETDNNSSDKFLKSALEDNEFRDFFYSTADRIFKDNNIENISKQFGRNIHNKLQNFKPDINHVKPTENNGLDIETVLRHPNNVQTTNDNVLECSISSQDDDSSNTNKTKQNLDLTKVEIDDNLSPPERLVRRNSYTLESPSPILLEHLAKEKATKYQMKEKWTSLSDKKQPEKKLGFKTFTSTKQPRKTWHKKENTKSKPLLSLTTKDLHSCRRSRTFIKTNSGVDEINISLPASSRASPIHLSSFSQSSECIQSIPENQNKLISSLNLNSNQHFDQIKANTDPFEIGFNQNLFLHDNKTLVFEGKDTSYFNNRCGNINNDNCSSGITISSQNQTSPINVISPKQSSYISSQPTFTYANRNKDIHNNSPEHTSDLEDIVSVCSSLSLSKFVPLDDITSRPSTRVDLSTMFSELQLHHERQIKELLEKQHREKSMLTKLHVTNELSSSRCTTNMSNTSELPFENCVPSEDILEETKTSCSRELFPNKDDLVRQSLIRKEPEDLKYDSKKEKDAALKLTSCVRGYLTRRLLKTEKVQQLIDTIKESLNCAFSLQSESHLRKIDLDLHERLAHQLSAALYELQTIISSPVAIRMGIIAADREKLRKPLSRPSSAISSATQKSILRRQQSLNSGEKRLQDRKARSKSLCLNGQDGPKKISNQRMIGSTYSVKSDLPNTEGTGSSSSRKPWK